MSQKNFHDNKLSRSISIRTRHFELLKRHRFYSFLIELMKVSPTLRQKSGVNKSANLGRPNASLFSTGPSSTDLSLLGQNRVSTNICKRSASKF